MHFGKTHILHAIRQGKIGGGETYVLQLVERLDGSRYEQSVLSFTDGPLVDRLREMGVKCWVIPAYGAFDMHIWPKLSRCIRDNNPDVIHVHGSLAASNLVPVAKSFSIPILYTIHGWSFHADQHPFHFYLRKKAEQWITRRTTLNINVSYADQQLGKRYLKNFFSRVIHNAVDINLFNPDHYYPDIRAEFQIPQDAIIIAFIARLTKQKNPDVLLKAFERLLSISSSPMYLLIVGDGELRQKMSDWVFHHRLNQFVRFTGYRQDIPALLAGSDIYCLPSLWEGLPIGLLEAMAMKKLVIASDIPPHREIIIHEKNGLLFHHSNESQLTDLFLKASSNKEWRVALQESARETITEKYSIYQMIQQIEEIYEYIISPTSTFVFTR
ncbi:MAG: glycosyltransferase family 4 protein [Thermoflavifilum sp.]|nr:glycosyltransferase family 4 protein [Thermoflavifilum sp.]